MISTEPPNISSTGLYKNGILTVPLLLALGNRYVISFSLKSENPIQFRVVSAEPVPRKEVFDIIKMKTWRC